MTENDQTLNDRLPTCESGALWFLVPGFSLAFGVWRLEF
jgi:hypothetical protein